ncbi:hypothetical protein MPSEU_001106100 [Mayamaea pseudoterrestris]|nr:hypothetical protein MPSEU_001106100 [Mayamaea pseudoterrestris]
MAPFEANQALPDRIHKYHSLNSDCSNVSHDAMDRRIKSTLVATNVDESSNDDDEAWLHHGKHDDDDVEVSSRFQSDTSTCNIHSQESTKQLLRQAFQLPPPPPSCFTRIMLKIYANRQKLVWMGLHLVATLCVWTHYFIIKFHRQKESLDSESFYYWMRLIVPSLDYGAAHAILLQMAILPLTVMKRSITSLALQHSNLEKYVPLRNMPDVHAYVGYWIFALATLGLTLGMGLTSFLCLAHGEQEYCDKLTSEIMMSGLAMFGLITLITVSSLIRRDISYAIFLKIHRIGFLLLYVITIAHTFDNQQRAGAMHRSQCFSWVAASFLLYVCDRLAQPSYRTTLLHCSLIQPTAASGYTNNVESGADTGRMLIIKLHRPTLLQFQPGQYARLRIPAIGTSEWHPFSFASEPESFCMEFVVQVSSREESWTNKLWKHLEQQQLLNANETTNKLFPTTLHVDVMGPYGTPLAQTSALSHALVIGTGTGIVPILSMYKQHMRRHIRLNPKALRDSERRRRELNVISETDGESGSSAHKLWQSAWCWLARHCHSSDRYNKLMHPLRSDLWKELIRDDIHRSAGNAGDGSPQERRRTMHELRKAAAQATRSMLGVVLLGHVAIFGFALVVFTISWHSLDAAAMHFSLWTMSLLAGSAVFQLMFAMAALFRRDSGSIYGFVDVLCIVVAPFCDWYWCKLQPPWSPAQVTLYCCFTAYMVLRVWSMAVEPHYKTIIPGQPHGGLERLDVIWICRSALLVSEILPDIESVWNELVASVGVHRAKQVCRVRIYVTDPNVAANELLQLEWNATSLFQCFKIYYGRPNVARILEHHFVHLVCSQRSSTNTLLAYVGRKALALEIRTHKLLHDMTLAMIGNDKHQMELVLESHESV